MVGIRRREAGTPARWVGSEEEEDRRGMDSVNSSRNPARTRKRLLLAAL